MVKLGHFQYIQDRTCTSRLGIHAAHHYFRDTGLHNGTGAHLAGFQGHIERAFFQTPVADHFAGFVDRCDLCVRQCILVCISPVVTTTDDLTFMYNDTADGDFPQGIGFFRLLQSFLHIFFFHTFDYCHGICSLSDACVVRGIMLWKTFSKKSHYIS